ncbi:bifunctional 3-(3-hydroxy-phenyl)propionate/3-hydroxycinnamic acid hydroxylase MhpA [Paraburkholderia sediminicola]|uniref:bifunctional 3-(3-hydroxy-phenyl)propionate/3-hydroxycinnamic acid hydroxylase MhpA n=1 Tax=Paraburkholderia sediminicola TaxID=458836 RepID=UPI0038BD20F5
MSTTQTFDADVVIIGYGPSGVAAANALGAYGVKTIAIERDRDIYPRARAVTVNDWTMRLFQSIGLDDQLSRNMDRTRALRWITYDGRELTHMEFPRSTLGHPRSYAIYQPVMEEILRRGVQRFQDHVTVRFGEELVDIAQNETGVTVTSRDKNSGVEHRIRARYALACDGGSSSTRERLGVKLLGETVETRWVVIDARVKRWWPHRNILTFWSDKKRPVVDIALALGNHRWEFPLEPHETDADFSTHEQLWKLLNSLGVTDNEVEIYQHAFYKHHVRHAETWRVGRVFLLGDAAHLMPPWAGQGMQSGIRDAFNLSWKLREVLAGRLPESLLDTYEIERAPHVAEMTAIAVEMGRIIKQQLSEEEMKALAAPPPSDQAPPEPPLLRPPVLRAGWVRGPLDEGSIVGKMVPQPRVAGANGKLCMLDDQLGHGFVLLGNEVDPETVLSTTDRQAWANLGASFLTLRSAESRGVKTTDIIDLDGSLIEWMREFKAKVIAIRPDRFVAAADGFGLSMPI